MIVKEKLEEIEEQGKKLRRRLEYLERESDFLVDTIIDRPIADTSPQRRLLQEWKQEIEEIGRGLEYLRAEYLKYKNMLPTKKVKRL